MSLHTSPLLIWFCGNYTLDTKLFNGPEHVITKQSYGGSVNFGSQTILKFFPDVSCEVYSNGFPVDVPHKSALLNYHTMQSTNDQQLTHYKLDYRFDKRKLTLEYFPSGEIIFPVSPERSPDILMITPIYQELSEQIVIQLHTQYPTALISCDPQGWCRQKNTQTNEIELKDWMPSTEFLSAASIVKLSIEDVFNSSHNDFEGFIRFIVGHKVILILTKGIQGNFTFIPEHNSETISCLYTPAVQVTDVVDTTGAGDVWLTVFTTLYHTTKNIKNALAEASVITSLKIQAERTIFKDIDQEDFEKQVQQLEKVIKTLDFEEGIEKTVG